MKDPIKKALTRRTRQREIPPDPRLLVGVKFTLAMTLILSALEITHIAFLARWNSEIFSAITGLTGTLTGILITQKPISIQIEGPNTVARTHTPTRTLQNHKVRKTLR